MGLNNKLTVILSSVLITLSFSSSVFASDAIIDKRNTEADNIVITEAEEGMFSEGSKLILALDKIEFEDDIKYDVVQGDIEIEAEVTDKRGIKQLADVNDEDMKLYKDNCSYIVITVIDESTEASVIEISGLKLYLDRTLPNGEYALKSVYSGDGIWSNSSADKDEYDKNGVFKYEANTVDSGYVNIISNGRDKDDSTVNSKITLNIGDEKLLSGEKEILLDAPAYINENGYAMLPLRAVAEALDATVSWDKETETVSILRGQRIITMKVGSNEMYINGTKVPMNTEVEIKHDRVFVPVRDTASALSISEVQWNENTNTIVLN